jgi:hypothetical protein
VFLQLHLVLGYVLGPAARDAIDTAKGPAIAVILLVALGGGIFWFIRKRRTSAAAEAWTEASCPACLALSFVGERLAR